MGANEKHAATYHGGEYTPATENVEHSYVAYRSSKVDLITGHHEFTRWLETVRAEAKAEAWQAGEDAGWENGRNSLMMENSWIESFDLIENPYKEQS